MITYLEISLFDSPAQTIVNTVNTVGVMGKGIALVFRQLYPDMYKEYRKLCDDKKLSVGKLYIYRTANKIVVNFPTKQHWRNPSRLDYIDAGLRKFIAHYHDYGISSVSFPQLGCGNGELNWQSQVQPIMEKYLKDLPIPVYIHLYPQDPDFVPERLDKEYSRQVGLERQRVSMDQLWQDLKRLALGGINKPYQLSLFDSGFQVQDNYILLSQGLAEPHKIYREDIEDLWNTLRIRGTISEADLPVSIQNDQISEWLFGLLGRLEYIHPIQIRKRGNLENGRGLRYVPHPERTSGQTIDVLV